MRGDTSSFRASFSITTPAIPPFSKDTMKEGAMCFWVTSKVKRSILILVPTQYHLLFKTYKQAAMHWVTSKI